jgi:hypothetical protein
MVCTKRDRTRVWLVWWWACAALATGALWLAPTCASAAQEAVTGVRFAVQGQKVHVSYELAGQGAYTVSLRLLQGAERRVAATPRSVTGDVGPGVAAGTAKTIVWDALKDVEALEGRDYSFEVRAVRPGGTSKWVWIGGAGLVAGGAGVVMATGAVGGEDKGTIVIDVPDPEE